MVRVTITLRELSLLLNCSKNLNLGKKVLIAFNEKEIEDIVEDISNYLMAKGLKNNYEPNSIGNELETVIDKFVLAQQEDKGNT